MRMMLMLISDSGFLHKGPKHTTTMPIPYTQYYYSRFVSLSRCGLSGRSVFFMAMANNVRQSNMFGRNSFLLSGASPKTYNQAFFISRLYIFLVFIGIIHNSTLKFPIVLSQLSAAIQRNGGVNVDTTFTHVVVSKSVL